MSCCARRWPPRLPITAAGAGQACRGGRGRKPLVQVNCRARSRCGLCTRPASGTFATPGPHAAAVQGRVPGLPHQPRPRPPARCEAFRFCSESTTALCAQDHFKGYQRCVYLLILPLSLPSELSEPWHRWPAGGPGGGGAAAGWHWEDPSSPF